MSTPLSVLVTGDIVIDLHVYEGDRLTLSDHPSRGTRLVEETGGAALSHRLISAVFAADLAERQLVRRCGWGMAPVVAALPYR